MRVECVIGGRDVMVMPVSEFNDRYPIAAEVWSAVTADTLDGLGGERFRLTVWDVPALGVVVVSSRPIGSDDVMSDDVGVVVVASLAGAFGFVAEVTRVEGVAVVGR